MFSKHNSGTRKIEANSIKPFLLLLLYNRCCSPRIDTLGGKPNTKIFPTGHEMCKWGDARYVNSVTVLAFMFSIPKSQEVKMLFSKIDSA